MKVRCPNCQTLYRVQPDWALVSDGRARCGRCSEVFPISDHQVAAPAVVEAAVLVSDADPLEIEVSKGTVTPSEFAIPRGAETILPLESAPRAPAARAEAEPTPTTGAHFFGPQDPHLRARHLARALVSDIIAYYPERLERSRAAGTLRDEFREEILKSWEEFALQVGEEFARETDHFQTALNEILASGAQSF